MDYTLIKSKRKTISVEIRGGEVIVRAPNRIPKRDADAFVRKHEDWINQHLTKAREQQMQLGAVEKLTEAELGALTLRAKQYLPIRARYFAGLIGVEYGRITIRCQRTRWGSCSTKKNLNFNCLLMLAPPEVIDAVVAHEICHLKEMNHSDRFYELVLGVCPDYRRHNQWLKENGKALLARLP